MMRVLHVYSGNLYGGLEGMLATMARTAPEFPDVDTQFALCFCGHLATELRAAGATVHALPPVRVSRPWTVWRSRRALGLVLRGQRLDAVVCHSPWPYAVFGPVARSLRTRLVFWTHQYLTGTSFDQRWARWCPPALAVSNSSYVASSVGTLFPGLRTEVVYCPYSLPATDRPDARHEVRAELEISPDAQVILQACRLQSLKGHRLHLRALGLLRDLPGWVCWFAGGVQRPEEQAYLDELHSLAAELGIADRVRFLGQCRDVSRLLAAADVVCHPNEAPDSFGLAFVDGLSAGLPVVTTRMGGAVEVVDETCGVLVDPTAESVAGALRELLTKPELARKLGANGPARAEALCNPVRNMTRFYELLRDAA